MCATEKLPTHHVGIVFWSGMGLNVPNLIFGQKMPVLGQIWLFWGKNTNFTGVSKSFSTHMAEESSRHLVRIVFWSGIG